MSKLYFYFVLSNEIIYFILQYYGAFVQPKVVKKIFLEGTIYYILTFYKPYLI